MKITPKFVFVEGSFDTQKVKMVCTVSDKYGEVSLSIQEQGCGFSLGFAQIKLYSGNARKDFDATVEDARKLGEEICRRWNNC
ncbi:MAG: hypothetical protein IJ780_01045, partial [Neisseriaceae bacterium]|nr:hypothetical protein [Neisseriaceae bacterium]